MRQIKILCIVFSQSAFKMCTSCVQFYQWQKPFTTVLSNETPKMGMFIPLSNIIELIHVNSHTKWISWSTTCIWYI